MEGMAARVLHRCAVAALARDGNANYMNPLCPDCGADLRSFESHSRHCPERLSDVSSALARLIVKSHVGRCVIQGCYYGEYDHCIYCGAARPAPVLGESPIKADA